MLYFEAKIDQISPQTLQGELTALPQTPRWI